MGKEVIAFGNSEFEKHKLPKIQLSSKFLFGKKGFK